MAGEAPPHTAVRNIDAVVRLEAEAAERRNAAERVADWVAARVGTLAFGLAHIALVAGWTAANLETLPGIQAWDPYPFGLLGGVFSLEGVLLASFLLIKQNRLGARADERAHLDLQVSLLAEQEITKVIQMLDRLTGQLGLEPAATTDREVEEFRRVTAVDDLARRVREELPQAEPEA